MPTLPLPATMARPSPGSMPTRPGTTRRLALPCSFAASPTEVGDAVRNFAAVRSFRDRFIDEYVPCHLQPSTQGEYERCVDIFINPEIGMGSPRSIPVTRCPLAARCIASLCPSWPEAPVIAMSIAKFGDDGQGPRAVPTPLVYHAGMKACTFSFVTRITPVETISGSGFMPAFAGSATILILPLRNQCSM